MTLAKRRRARAVAGALLLHLLPGAVSAQGWRHVFQGRVTTDSAAAIAGATIVVTMAPTAEVFRAASDSNGRYLIAIPNGTGEYVLYVGAPGRLPLRRRVTMAQTDSVYVADARLASAVPTLSSVNVRAQRSRPTRTLGADALGGGTDGMDKTVDGVVGAVSPELEGDLAALAATIPGLTVTASGATAFGLSTDQAKTTVNGLSFPQTELPRGVRMVTRFRTSPWDPTLGGFGSFLSSTSIARGGNISSRYAGVTLETSALPGGDVARGADAGPLAMVSVNEGGSGAFVLDRWLYNYGIQASRRTTPVIALNGLNAVALADAGVARDSAARLLTIGGALGIPVGGEQPDRGQTSTSVSFLQRVDRVATPAVGGGAPGPSAWITAYGHFRQSQSATLKPTVTALSTARVTDGTAVVQGAYSRYLGSNGRYVNELTTGLSYSASTSRPEYSLPTARVDTYSDLNGNLPTFAELSAGSDVSLLTRRTSWSWEVVNQTTTLLGGRASMPLKLYLQSRIDRFEQLAPADYFGTFTFPSLAALESNQPSSFARSLNASSVAGGEWTTAAALAGTWMRGNVTWIGGLRLDGNRFLNRLPMRDTLANALREPADYVPNGVGLSPRIGFSWRYRGGPTGFSSAGSELATINRGGPQLRGGVGAFRGGLPATLIGAALRRGEPGGELLCLGAATPVPQWRIYAADTETIPDRCIGSSQFADSSRAYTLFDRGYRAPESWRASLGWTGSIEDVYVSIDGTYSLNLHQPGVTDLNFAGVPRLQLPGESNRPVFVAADAVVPATGAIAAAAARVVPELGHVSNHVADLRGVARQLTIYAIPNLPARLGIVTLGYTWSDARSQWRGFDLTTAGDPRVVEWQPNAFTPRHQLVVQAARSFGQVGLTAYLRLASGLPYTPIVGGDINGDGLVNDRAFVFAPGSAAEGGVATEMDRLFAVAPSGARRCLTDQIGRIATANSCIGNWTAATNVRMVVFPAIPGTGGRARVALNLANPLAAADRLLHGSAGLRGWGTQSAVDPTLYQIRGFDPAAGRFTYSVNPKFGRTHGAVGIVSPYRLTLDVAMDIGHSYQDQEVVQSLRIRPVLLGTRAPADSIRDRFRRANFTDVFGVLLSLADSLVLSRAQIEQLQRHSDALRARADSLYGALASDLAALPGDYDVATAVARVAGTNDAMWEVIFAQRSTLLAILTPGQIRRLPPPIFEMLTVPSSRRRFFFG